MLGKKQKNHLPICTCLIIRSKHFLLNRIGAALKGGYSPDFESSIFSIVSLSLKFVDFILASIGLIDVMWPANLASIIIPNVPVIFNPISVANFLPFRSSIIKRQSSNSRANAIALASPLSTVA